MRRLFLLLLGLVAFGALLPVAPAAAAAAHHKHAMLPGHCGDEGSVVTHVCLGCAVAPLDPAPFALGRASPASRPVARLVSIPEGHRPGSDPPPPRAFG
ncbi:MAG TPA: hypothetical protein VKQ09_00300 [Sphingomonas sp.]|nr:hypothetical protein [Sphingomonas sp.]